MRRRKALSLMGAAVMSAACRPDELFSPRLSSVREDGSYVLLHGGDFHSRLSNASHAVAALARRISSRETINQIMLNGDNAADQGSTSDYQDRFEDAIGDLKHLLQMTLGNHDVNADPDGDPYFDYCEQRGILAGNRGEGYYSKFLGDYWVGIYLNTEYKREEQTAHLRTALPMLSTRHKIVFMHKQMFSSPGGTVPLPAQLGPWWDLFVEHKVDMVLAGHNHRYERFAPKDRNGVRTSAGVRQFLCGTAGGGIMPITGPLAVGSQRQVLEHGLLKVTLNQNSYNCQFITTKDVVADNITLATKQVI